MKEKQQNKEFWQSGNGRDFLEWATISTDQLDSKYSKNLFDEYDQEVDALVAAWLEEGTFGYILGYLHGKASDENLPTNFIAFRNKWVTPPDWVDFSLIAMGSKCIQRSSVVGLMIMQNFALLGGYNFSNLIKPLVMSGALEKSVGTRLYNTLNFWIEASRTYENAQEMRFNAAIRTRLVHSVSRVMIHKRVPQWDAATYGVPLNHADMIATNIAFTVYFLYGLDKLNFTYTPEEEKGVFHLWKYITWLFGVPEELIPNDRKEALNFFYFWTKYQEQPDEDSIKLANSLLNDYTAVKHLKSEFANKNVDLINKSIANYLIDDQIKAALQIPKIKFENFFPAFLKIQHTLMFRSYKSQIKKGHKKQMKLLEDYRNNVISDK